MTHQEKACCDAYFEWMYQLVYPKRHSYRKLLHCLHWVDFEVQLFFDENRAEDGVDLRYRFGVESGYDDRIVAIYLDNRKCSVLEMMVALAIRCEEHIMDDPEVGCRISDWFWRMVKNLGLISMYDSQFDLYAAKEVVRRFLNREYKANGRGGLFLTKRQDVDMTTMDIWYQMCLWLCEQTTEKER